MTSIEKINLLLKEHGMSGAELCRKIEVSTGVYSQWNKGRSGIKPENIKKIADVFQVPVSSLYDDEDDEMDSISKTEQEEIRFALFHGADIPITDEMYDEVKRFADFVVQREKDKLKKG